MAKAKKLPSGNWRVNLFVGYDEYKKRIYKSFTDPDKKQSEFMAAEYAAGKRKKAPSDITVGEAIDKYIVNKDAVLSPSTIRGYKNIRRNDIQELMKIKLSSLTSELVQQIFNEEAKAKSPKTISNAHGLLSSALGAYLPELKLTTTLPQKRKTVIYIPTKEEISTLFKSIEGTEMDLPVLLAANLGLRRSEISALTWADFDAKNGNLSINKAMVPNDANEWIIKPPKSYAGYRVLPLPQSLIDKLKAIAGEEQEAIVKINPDIISLRFYRLLKKYGLKKFRFHDLRHYNASLMLALNIPNKYAMERMGHATDNMLKTVYQHTMSDKQKEITKAINDYLDENMQHDLQHNNVKP